jgi:hypothetical protein
MERSQRYIYPIDVAVDSCDVPEWLRFMTASELELDRPKLTIDFRTGEQYVSYPVGWLRGVPVPAESA